MKTNKLVKRLIAALLIVITSLSSQELQGQTTIYQEYFNNPTQLTCGQFMWINDMTGVSGAWAIDVSRCPEKDAAFQYCVMNNKFSAWNLRGEAIWYSKVMDIKDHLVKASVQIDPAINMESNDYIKIYYKLDGKHEILMNNGAKYGNIHESVKASIEGIRGTKFQIVIRVKNDDMLEKHYFDNIKVEGLHIDKTYFGESDFNISDFKGSTLIESAEKIPLEFIKITESYNGNMNLNIMANEKEDLNISIYNLLGQLILSKNENIQYSGFNSIKLDTGNIPQGQYVITIQTQKDEISEKFFKY